VHKLGPVIESVRFAGKSASHEVLTPRGCQLELPRHLKRPANEDWITARTARRTGRFMVVIGRHHDLRSPL
jgi:hypothetical protein